MRVYPRESQEMVFDAQGAACGAVLTEIRR